VIFDGGIDDKTLLVTERLPDAVAGMKVKPRKRENDSPRASQNRPMNSSIESSQSYSGGAPQ